MCEVPEARVVELIDETDDEDGFECGLELGVGLDSISLGRIDRRRNVAVDGGSVVVASDQM